MAETRRFCTRSFSSSSNLLLEVCASSSALTSTGSTRLVPCDASGITVVLVNGGGDIVPPLSSLSRFLTLVAYIHMSCCPITKSYLVSMIPKVSVISTLLIFFGLGKICISIHLVIA